jgi:RimJ/RimL family protein N-acetyltransferase
VEEADLPTFFAHQLDAEAIAMAAVPARDRDAFTAHWARILVDETGVKRTILADGEIAGNVVSWHQDDERLVGYWLGREHWGRGVATAALSAFLRLETRRPLRARVAAHNTGSIRVLEKCGFSLVGTEQAPALTEPGDIVELIMELDEDATPGS